MKKAKNFILKILLITFSIFTTIALLELSINIYNLIQKKTIESRCKKFDANKFVESLSYTKEYNYYKPFEDVVHCSTEFDYVYHIDKNGLRMYKSDKKNKSILAIGDSFTFGFGVKDEESFPSLLNAYNAGMWGDPFNYQFESFKRNIVLFKPKIILWGLYPSHIITLMPGDWSSRCPGDSKYLSDNTLFLETIRYSLDKFILPVWNKSALGGLIMKNKNINKINIENNALIVNKNCFQTKEIILYDKNIENNKYTYDSNINKTFYKDRSDVYNKMKNYFASAKTIADSQKTTIYYLLIPSRYYLNLKDGSIVNKDKNIDIDPDLPNNTITKMLIESGYSKNNIIDLGKNFLNEDDWKKYYFKTDAHWNAKGQKFVAETIKKIIDKRKENKLYE